LYDERDERWLLRIYWTIPVMAVWGSSYVVIKAGLPHTSPIFFAALRALPAGIVILLWRAINKDRLNPRRHSISDWLQVMLLGFLCTALFFWAMFFGTPVVGAGLAAVLINTQPFFVAVIAWLFLSEHLNCRKTVYLIVGFMGVILISWPKIRMGYSTEFLGVAAMLGGAVGFSVGLVLAKSLYQRLDLYWVTGWQLLLGGLMLLSLAFMLEDISKTLWSPRLLVATGYLSIVGTAAASLVWFRLIRHHPVSVLASYAFLSPVFGIIFARLIYKEAFTAWSFSGMALIIIGLYGIERAGVPSASSIPPD